MTTPLVAIILGSGPRIGLSVANKLKSEGYKVVVGSRNPKEEDAKKAGFYPIKVDLADPASVDQVFAQVEKDLGPASVVVYNAAAFTPAPSGPTDPLSLPYSTLLHDTNIVANSAYVAAHNAVKGFRKLPADFAKVFIVTGNILPFSPIPLFVSLGYGKAAIAHVLALSAQAYEKEGFRFYFASQVSESGGPSAQDLDGPTHAEVYHRLIKQQNQGNWDVRFLKGGKLYN